MRVKCFALLAVAMAMQAPGLLAQETDLAFVSSGSASVQPMPGEKSPFLAGALSFFVPGLGSFYAGNSGHGVPHLAVAAASFGGMIAQSDCGITLMFSNDNDCTLYLISGGVFIVNWIWSIATGASDAKDYNRSLYTTGLQVEPALVAIRSGGQSTIGLQVLRFGF